MTKLIDQLQLPDGLRQLEPRALKQVAEELRGELIDAVALSGGHLASSLGVAELTVALHHVFDTPRDRLVWDVGHQGYVHKMIAGRRRRMHTIRKSGGISGYLRRDESEYDAFGAGHAGTSISAAVGMAAALQREAPERYVVAVIGDGAMTCGMAFEGLNHAGDLGLRNLVVVLNDNEMSIAPNVGAISHFFSMAVTSTMPTRARSKLKSLYRKGYIPGLVYKAFDRAEEVTQGLIAGPATLFDAFGFRYIGPVDGHNMDDLVRALLHAKEQDVPVLVHVRTVKGKGYEPAEEDPIGWHGVRPFQRDNGKFIPISSKKKLPPSYTDVFGRCIVRLARQFPKLTAITAAMPSGTGLDKFQELFPERFYDVGICESHAVTFAAGQACEGLRPVCAIYSTFLQRSYDQVLHDVCIQNLPVVFAIDRAGAVGDDGETHQGVFDIAYLRSIPNMTIMAPKDENELQHMLYTAVRLRAPVAVRYPRGCGQGIALDTRFRLLPIGKAEVLQRGHEVLFVALGSMVQYAKEAAELIAAESDITCTIINARFAKPLDAELLARELPRHALVCTLEDHALAGGFGSAVGELINDQGIALQAPLKRFGIGDRFVPHASQREQHALHGCDPQSISRWVLESVQPRQVVALRHGQGG